VKEVEAAEIDQPLVAEHVLFQVEAQLGIDRRLGEVAHHRLLEHRRDAIEGEAVGLDQEAPALARGSSQRCLPQGPLHAAVAAAEADDQPPGFSPCETVPVTPVRIMPGQRWTLPPPTLTAAVSSAARLSP